MADDRFGCHLQSRLSVAEERGPFTRTLRSGQARRSASSVVLRGSCGQAVADVSFAPQTDTSTSMTSDGNNVNTDTEMSNLTQNAIQYETLAAVERERMGMIQTAMGGN